MLCFFVTNFFTLYFPKKIKKEAKKIASFLMAYSIKNVINKGVGDNLHYA